MITCINTPHNNIDRKDKLAENERRIKPFFRSINQMLIMPLTNGILFI